MTTKKTTKAQTATVVAIADKAQAKTEKTVAALNKRIDTWAKAATAIIETDAMSLAIACLTHFNAHGDTGPIHRMHTATPSGAAKQRFAIWVMTFSPVHFKDQDAKTGNYKKAVKREESSKFFCEFDAATAEATPWWTNPETIAKPIKLPNLMQMIKQATARLDKAASANAEDLDPSVTPEAIAKERALLDKMRKLAVG